MTRGANYRYGEAWSASLAVLERESAGDEPVDLGGHDQVVRAQAADRVRRPGHGEAAPGNVERGVVVLALREQRDARREAERGGERRERELAGEAVAQDLPRRIQPRRQPLDLFGCERRGRVVGPSCGRLRAGR